MPRSRLPQSLDDLTLDVTNANRGTDRGRRLLAESLQTHGAGRPVLLDRRGRVIAGNKTVEQARALGMPLKVVASDGDVLIAHVRLDLDLTRDPHARALAVKDNRVAELDLDWDPDVLRALHAEGVALDGLWTEQEWRAAFEDATDDEIADRLIEPRETTIGRGDLFALGPHRLLCGDATHAEDVARLNGLGTPVLMTTDPPYGVRYDPRWRSAGTRRQRTAAGRVLNDDQAAWPGAFQHFTGDVVYAWHGGTKAAAAATALETAGFDIRAQIIWVKPHFVLGRGDYHHQHEPCFYAVRRGRPSRWRGGRDQSTVWEVAGLNPIGQAAPTGDDARTPHSTQKPMRLFERPILHHTDRGDIVYDPFVGSGTTLMAAERTGRIAHVMDLDPRYVQLVIDRWEAATGQRATPVTVGQGGAR